MVTGASSGIGAATARALAHAGAAVTIGARRADRLEALAVEIRAAGGRVVVRPTDMRREDDVLALIATARESFGGVDVLVNNAGLGRAAPLSSGATEVWREMLEVNVLGLAIATREAVRDMERRGVEGHVVHVSSMAGHRVPGPDSGMYAATKFAVRALTEALRQELRTRKSAIRVSAISPGHVFTEFADVFSGRPGAQAEIDRRSKILEPCDVAEAVLWAVTRPARVDVSEIRLFPANWRAR